MVSETPSPAATVRASTANDPARLFRRILVGIDRSQASFEAARQAALLSEPDGQLTLLAAWNVPPPTLGVVGPDVSHELEAVVYLEAAANSLTKVKAATGAAVRETRLVRGFGWDELIKEARREHDDLIVVGRHGRGRLHGILLGSTATEITHKAPCSVLIARPVAEGFPRRIVVGVDGSPESAVAFSVAAYLADRFDSELWPVVAHGGKAVSKARAAAITGPRHEDLPDEPLSALVAAAADADLVVVGSRGLHGLKALGSVSERVAHEVHCSALIVRQAPWQL